MLGLCLTGAQPDLSGLIKRTGSRPQCALGMIRLSWGTRCVSLGKTRGGKISQEKLKRWPREKAYVRERIGPEVREGGADAVPLKGCFENGSNNEPGKWLNWPADTFLTTFSVPLCSSIPENVSEEFLVAKTVDLLGTKAPFFNQEERHPNSAPLPLPFSSSSFSSSSFSLSVFFFHRSSAYII